MQNGVDDRARATRARYDAPKVVVLGNAAELTMGPEGNVMEFLDTAVWISG